jgi:hypothetical protein
MLLFVIGPPGRFAERCIALTVQLAERALERIKVIHANTLEEIARGLLRLNISHGLVASHQPGGQLRRALTAANLPFIVAVDDPRAVLSDLVAGRGIEMATATQMVASSCASSMCFSAMPCALVLRADRDRGDRLAMATAIARHLRLELDDGEIAEVVRGLDATDAPSEGATVSAWWDDLDQAERTIADGALDAYIDLSAGRELGTLDWAAGLFFVGDRPTEHVKDSIDITGRMRCLLRGPQIMLPPGIWSLSAALHISPDAAEHSFLVEVMAGHLLSSTIIRPKEAGVIEADLTLTLEELPDQPLDLRLSNERPAFHGQLTLLRVTLTPQAATPSTSPVAR